MIKKFINIKSIGKFVNYSAPGDVELKKLNIIYGENGSGKTTLCSILKSLKTGNSDYILGRKSFHSTDSPIVDIRLSDRNVHFADSTWDQVFPEIELFDSTFIVENVCAGHDVHHYHKKALHNFVIGEEGVRLTNEIHACDEKIREINSRIAELQRDIQKHIVGALSIDDFVSLHTVEDVDRKISEKQELIKALEQAEEIKRKSKFAEIKLPDWNLNFFKAILSKSIEEISNDAENTIKKHIANCLDERGEGWLAYGLEHIKDDKCPFCGLGLTGLELIDAYKQYFNKQYIDFKKDIFALLTTEKDKVAIEKLIELQKSISTNETLYEYWKQHISFDLTLPNEIYQEIDEVWRILSKQVNLAIDHKSANILDKYTPSDELLAAHTRLEDIKAKVTTYNQQTALMNEKIQMKKDSITAGDLTREKKDLFVLQNARSRHSAEAVVLCNEYIAKKAEKAVIEREKESPKDNLRKVTEEIIRRYQEGINGYLSKFGADFTIVEKEIQYRGGTPSISYKIMIGERAIPLGDTETPDSEPCFRNTLSDGDKSTLAFAFFMSKLDLDTQLSSKVVVFDDPISSLDIHRRRATIQELIKKANTVAQVIVLTHDPVFAKIIYDSFDKATTKCLLVRRQALDSTIEEWDIISATASDYYRSYYTLEKYLEDGSGDPLSVARSIRPVIEGNLRNCFPTIFRDDMWLGDFIREIRDADDRSLLSFLKSCLSELDNINDYSKDFHHPDFNSVSINQTELKSYVQRTIKFLSR